MWGLVMPETADKLHGFGGKSETMTKLKKLLQSQTTVALWKSNRSWANEALDKALNPQQNQSHVAPMPAPPIQNTGGRIYDIPSAGGGRLMLGGFTTEDGMIVPTSGSDSGSDSGLDSGSGMFGGPITSGGQKRSRFRDSAGRPQPFLKESIGDTMRIHSPYARPLKSTSLSSGRRRTLNGRDNSATTAAMTRGVNAGRSRHWARR